MVGTPIGAATQYTLCFLRFVRENSGGAITLNQMLVLLAVTMCYLWRHRCRHSELVEATGLSKATVSRAVAKLRAARMVREVVDPNDSRQRDVVPTEGYVARRREFLERYFIERAPADEVANVLGQKSERASRSRARPAPPMPSSRAH